MNDEIYKTLDLMEKYGGSFVVQLAKLYRLADVINQAKLLATFENYFDDYSPSKWGK
jgi:hypothetical protein